jgi:3-methyladenine DNA glycosylase AlkC
MTPFFYLPHTLFVAERGLEHFELSMRAQYELTKRFSAEGSIRPYIASDPERAMTFLQKWTADTNPHVRRLVSEGTRLGSRGRRALPGSIKTLSACLRSWSG